MATKKRNAKAPAKAPKATKAKKVTRNSKKSEVEGHALVSNAAKSEAKAAKTPAKLD